MICVQWKKCCYLCHCPLDVEVSFDDDDDEAMWDLCMDFVPGEERLVHNMLRYKKLGGRVYPTCKSCFDLHFTCNPSIIRDREIGKTRLRRPQTRGYTRAELEVWLGTCKRFIQRLRADENFGTR